uniref:Putative secreted protein n=1 Tax=Ixodes ricinus TaxID=34613 RepID=A0A6B0U318_IXORI
MPFSLHASFSVFLFFFSADKTADMYRQKQSILGTAVIDMYRQKQSILGTAVIVPQSGMSTVHTVKLCSSSSKE